MTAAELMAALAIMPPDAPVFNDYPGYSTTIREVSYDDDFERVVLH